MSPDGKTCPRWQTGDGHEFKSRRHPAITVRPGQFLRIAGYHAARHALRAASIAVNLFGGCRPEEVAAKIARRTLAAPLAKPEAGPARANE